MCILSIMIGCDQLLVICGITPLRFSIGRSPDLRISIQNRLPKFLLSDIYGFALPDYSDGFVQDLHLFPFSSDTL